MTSKLAHRTVIVLLALFLCSFANAAPETFDQAKNELRRYVYQDQNDKGDLYCGCNWEWTGATGGRFDLKSCGYEVRAQQNRAERIEWEHILPASSFGQARQCWQNGGRENCNRTDPVFNAMEGDMHNLAPVVGEVNADRSNFRFSAIPGEPTQYGACRFEVDFKLRIAEPRDEIKGQVARIYFYMHDRYNLNMSDAQQRLYMAWDRTHPVTAWELERDRRIASRMGHSNPFVTGARTWEFGHKNVSEGIVTRLPASNIEPQPVVRDAPTKNSAVIRGNRNSKIYHLPQGCPSYDQISPRNIVEFRSETEAAAAGYRKARNCS
ncbi:MAG: endonuclease [Pseudohongiellaceae bacterium]|nr:endonuclease [Pseudohongiellaceae bacterium]